MFFKKLRSGSKSSSQSATDPTATRTLSNTISMHRRSSSKVPTITISQSDATTPDEERTNVEEGDYQAFLAKAKREEEEAKRRKIKAAKEAARQQKQVDMSPWSSRM